MKKEDKPSINVLLERAITEFTKNKDRIKEDIPATELFAHFKQVVPLFSEYEEMVWKDVLADMLLVYSWRMPTNLVGEPNLLALLETSFLTFVRIFYQTVIGLKLKEIKPVGQKEKQKNKMITDFLRQWTKKKEDPVN